MDLPAPRELNSKMEQATSRMRTISFLKRRTHTSPAPWTATTLQEQYLNTIFRYALVRLHSRAEAEDVTAEVFVAAFESLDKCPTTPERALAWLIGIACRKVADSLRRHERRREAPLEGFQIPTTSGTEQSVLDDETAVQLYTVLAHLKEEHREALLLKYADRLSLTEIGAVLGKSPNAVSSLLQRARAAAAERGKEYFAS
jgi:RNA polymerase sigma-70 factor (ECF subfamily)